MKLHRDLGIRQEFACYLAHRSTAALTADRATAIDLRSVVSLMDLNRLLPWPPACATFSLP